MGMTYEEVFSQVKKIFMEADVSGEKEHLAFLQGQLLHSLNVIYPAE